MRIKEAKFVTSAADFKNIPDAGPEIAVAGKSNVGKSSFINFLTNNGRLAKTSQTPGKTRLLNYFEVNISPPADAVPPLSLRGNFMLVDLPGYGYAKISEAEKAKWGGLIEGYFETSKNLKHVLLLVDIRHKPSQNDLQMLAYLYHFNIPFTVIATKADKLSRAEAGRSIKTISEALGLGRENILSCSASKKTGLAPILDRISQVVQT